MTNTINYIGSTRLLDSELHLFADMFTMLTHADPSYTITIDRRDHEILCHVKPSDPVFRPQLIENLLHYNRLKMPFRVRFSSSLALQKSVSFKISIDSLAQLKNNV